MHPSIKQRVGLTATLLASVGLFCACVVAFAAGAALTSGGLTGPARTLWTVIEVYARLCAVLAAIIAAAIDGSHVRFLPHHGKPGDS